MEEILNQNNPSYFFDQNENKDSNKIKTIVAKSSHKVNLKNVKCLNTIDNKFTARRNSELFLNSKVSSKVGCNFTTADLESHLINSLEKKNGGFLSCPPSLFNFITGGINGAGTGRSTASAPLRARPRARWRRCCRAAAARTSRSSPHRATTIRALPARASATWCTMRSSAWISSGRAGECMVHAFPRP